MAYSKGRLRVVSSAGSGPRGDPLLRCAIPDHDLDRAGSEPARTGLDREERRGADGADEVGDEPVDPAAVLVLRLEIFGLVAEAGAAPEISGGGTHLVGDLNRAHRGPIMSENEARVLQRQRLGC